MDSTIEFNLSTQFPIEYIAEIASESTEPITAKLLAAAPYPQESLVATESSGSSMSAPEYKVSSAAATESLQSIADSKSVESSVAATIQSISSAAPVYSSGTRSLVATTNSFESFTKSYSAEISETSTDLTELNQFQCYTVHSAPVLCVSTHAASPQMLVPCSQEGRVVILKSNKSKPGKVLIDGGKTQSSNVL